MGTNVNLTPELELFAQACVQSGRFNNVSEVVRSGLRMLQEAEQRRAAYVASLEAAHEEGLRERFATIEEVEVEMRGGDRLGPQTAQVTSRSSPRGRGASCVGP